MNSSNPVKSRSARGESVLAIGIMFFAVALLCLMLGWANGVRHGRAYLQFPTFDGWIIATVILAVLGGFFLFWSRSARRS